MALILVRATINLDSLGVGTEVLVDPEDPYMRDLLDATYLVPVPQDQTETTQETA